VVQVEIYYVINLTMNHASRN